MKDNRTDHVSHIYLQRRSNFCESFPLVANLFQANIYFCVAGSKQFQKYPLEKVQINETMNRFWKTKSRQGFMPLACFDCGFILDHTFY